MTALSSDTSKFYSKPALSVLHRLVFPINSPDYHNGIYFCRGHGQLLAALPALPDTHHLYLHHQSHLRLPYLPNLVLCPEAMESKAAPEGDPL